MGHSIADRKESSITVSTLARRTAAGWPVTGGVLHSDHGGQLRSSTLHHILSGTGWPVR
ncbi:hypothetical protein [Allokutzneria oryzae]|uniref:DDE-type integrase/transposase/recombinase n=1 Tax=Allokutzneria oryzae TaxID=1378989 RepID=A0ABV5ZXC4_9PSEU